MDVIINGAAGRMGRTVSDAAAGQGVRVAARVDTAAAQGQEGWFTELAQFNGPADCVLDFSHHAGTRALTAYCVQRGLPVVIATTGQTPEELGLIQDAARHVPVFLSANMSIGVALLADLARRAAAAFPHADVEIVECHHNQKLDVPSGTALMLARSLQEARPELRPNVGRHDQGKRGPDELGIHSLRYGSEVGTHQVILSDGSETLTLTHEAQDRTLFAKGALAAAAFILKKAPGLYAMKDLLGE